MLYRTLSARLRCLADGADPVREAAIEEELFRLPARGGHAPLALRWSVGAPPRAMLIVAHGMGEHAGRYLAPPAPIIRRGVDVAAIDHRGHGEDALAAASLGGFGEGGLAGFGDPKRGV